MTEPLTASLASSSSARAATNGEPTDPDATWILLTMPKGDRRRGPWGQGRGGRGVQTAASPVTSHTRKPFGQRPLSSQGA